jgi:outer membrane protein TolC
MNKIIISLIMVMANCTLVIENGHAQTLDDYFAIAAENNPGLQAKYTSFEVAMQKIPQVSALPDPTLSFGYFLSPVETRVGPQRARFSLTQMFPWFGTLKAQEDAASLMAEASFQEFLDARNKLYYELSIQYYALHEIDRLLSIEQENLAVLNSYKELATIKLENGIGEMTDVLRADIMCKDASTNLSILSLKKNPYKTRFNSLLNRSSNEAISTQDALYSTILPEEYAEEAMLSTNPLLGGFDLRIDASKANEQAVIKQGLPKIGVGLDYVIVGERTDMSLADNGRDVLMPMVSLSLPIFRKKYKASKKEAQLMQQSYSLQKQDLSNRLTNSYEQLSFEIQKQLALITLYDEQIIESDVTQNLLAKAYGNAGQNFEEVLRMQQQILQYQKMKVAAYTAYLTAVAELDYLTAKRR